MTDIGLLNEGNTCYMNSALQCLMHIPELQQYFLQPVKNNDGKIVYDSKYTAQQKYFLINRSMILKEFADQFKNLMVSLCDKDDKRPVRPLSFRKILSIFKPAFKTAEQQDAHECLTIILDTLAESLKMQVSINITGRIRTPVDERKNSAFLQYKNYLQKNGYSDINNLFYGQFDSTVVCKNCESSSYSYDPYNSLEVEIPVGANTLYDCIDKYCYQETLSGDNLYNCDKCKQKSQATKVLKIWTLPNVLIIQLKRFGTIGAITKNNRHIQFPMKLNMSKYLTHPNNATSITNTGLQLFDLIGVIEHSGGLNGGHYIAKCKSGKGEWLLFNDAAVNPIDENQIVTTNAYVLIYKMDEQTKKLWNK